MTEGTAARRLALDILIEYHRKDAYLNVLLASRLERSELERRDRALVTELVQGTVRMRGNLDFSLARFTERPLDEVDAGILWLLRLAAYQVLFTSVPDYAACDIATGIASEKFGRSRAGYVNGVMRAFTRGKEGVEYADASKDPAGYLEAKYSHPRWICEKWVRELGFDEAESLCAADNVARAVSLRTNLSRTAREELKRKLEAAEIEVEESRLVPEGLLARRTGSLGDLTAYRDGLFAVQDEASMLVGHAVAPEPGMRVLDMCAAPGGKTNHMAELMCGRGEVLALDINRRRLALVTREAARLGNRNVRTMTMDARNASVAMEERFDRVLVDAPCSGLGTLARRPDTRWRRSPDDLEGLVSLQRELIEAGAEMTIPGGVMVYSTCTVSREENEDQVGSFLERSPSFSPSESKALPETGGTFTRLMPDAHGTDGMFIAVLKKSTG